MPPLHLRKRYYDTLRRDRFRSFAHAAAQELRERGLKPHHRVLDVGCGNGYTSLALAAQRRIVLRGVDCIPEMVRQARRQAEILRGRLAGVAEFAVVNALELPEADETYDRILSIRVVINLGEWENQRRALREYARVLRPDGSPIPGLYAAGELVGGLFYFNYPGGTGLMSGSVFGRLAGTSAGRSTR